jgi:hypothetical protein
MGNKTRLFKLARKKIRTERNAIVRKSVSDVLALPFWDRFKIGVNMMFNRPIFKTD